MSGFKSDTSKRENPILRYFFHEKKRKLNMFKEINIYSMIRFFEKTVAQISKAINKTGGT